MDCAPFKTRTLRFEWEATNLTRPLIARYAMNGAQILLARQGASPPLTGPPAPVCRQTGSYSFATAAPAPPTLKILGTRAAASGRAGKAACGSVWYQNAVE